MFATTKYPTSSIENATITNLQETTGYPPMHNDPVFLPFLPTMSQTEYLRHFDNFLKTRPAFAAKEFIVNTPFGIMHYQPGQTTLKVYQNPKDSELLDVGEGAHQILAKITRLGECNNLRLELSQLITGKQIRTHMVSSRGVTIPTQGLVIATCANFQELQTYFDLGVKLSNGGIISWTNTSCGSLRHSGDPIIQFPGSDGITLKKTLTHFVTGFGSIGNTTGVIRFSAYNKGPMQQWNSDKCQCRPFAMAMLPSGEIFVLPVPMSEAQVGQNSACVAAVFKIANKQMTIRPACIATNGTEQGSDSQAMSEISNKGLRMASNL